MNIKQTSEADMLQAVETAAALVVMLLDEDGNVRLTGRGIETSSLPNILRKIADTIDPPKADQQMVTACAIAICPACGDSLMFPADLGIGAPGVVFANVCGCTAFLFAKRTNGGGVSVDLMSDEEFADLPDAVRAEMMRYRDVRAQRKQ